MLSLLQKCAAYQDLPTLQYIIRKALTFYKFDEKRAITPRWVIRFTSKLQVKKKIDRRVEPPDTFLSYYQKPAIAFNTVLNLIYMLTHV
jgi:hypothetical protein